MCVFVYVCVRACVRACVFSSGTIIMLGISKRSSTDPIVIYTMRCKHTVIKKRMGRGALKEGGGGGGGEQGIYHKT